MNRNRLRMVLEAIEDDRRGVKAEQKAPPGLTVEHVLPQAWGEHWPLPTGKEPLAAKLERDRLLHTFGNLTLATSSLNATLANHSWSDKRQHLGNSGPVVHASSGSRWSKRRAD
jgi:hypothetical protein